MQVAERFLAAIWATTMSIMVSLGLSTPPSAPTYQGYVEAEFVLAAPSIGGTLERLAVHRGARVKAGDPLFALDRRAEQAARDQAAAGLQQAKARLANLSKGQRQPEREVILARKQQAEAELRLAEAQLQRQLRLKGSTAFSPEQFDQVQASRDLAQARVSELTAALAAAKLTLGRADEIGMAESEVAAAAATLSEAEWRLGQKSMAAPAGGLVYDTFFNPGEWVAAGQPVLSLLPPGNVKVRFFVPQAALARVPVGARITVSCDGCRTTIPATVRYVSPEAEYTPPVLYNRENRNRLVFLVEAAPEADAALLRPGQPVDVALGRP